MLIVKQGGIKYHFLSLWYDSTWDWSPVSRTIGEDFTQSTNGPISGMYFKDARYTIVYPIQYKI